MKKIISLATAIMILMMSSFSVMAAPSPTAKVEAKKVLVDGKEVNLDTIKIKTTKKTVNPAEIDKSLEGMVVAYGIDVDLGDLEYEEIQITFSVPGIIKDENVKILSEVEDVKEATVEKDKWEIIDPDKVEDNAVTATFNYISTIFFLVDK